MPCFDKKLEASREELTDLHWQPDQSSTAEAEGVRDVDCVITARELLMLAENRGISFPSLPRRPLRHSDRTPFPDAKLDRYLFPSPRRRAHASRGEREAGTSGGYLWHIMQTYKTLNPGSELKIQRGRNADVVEYTLTRAQSDQVILRTARYYGFRNIQNLVRRLKPPKASRMPGAASRVGTARKPGNAAATSSTTTSATQQQALNEYAYVEVMACPGGCTNGGGQIKVGDVTGLRGGQSGIENGGAQAMVPAQKEWLALVDEAYYSASADSPSSSDDDDDYGDGEGEDVTMTGTDPSESTNGDLEQDEDAVDGISRRRVKTLLRHWSESTGVELDRLLYTTYRKVDSDVGKGGGDMERVAGLASSIGGGW
ncbi:hypothetical protein LTR28_010522 [Elasticomyces elasticus]|nr:hypothetical protein LTR28_010522 [Elasticomyces elasticus]